MTKRHKVATKDSGFQCMECGRKFRTIAAAEKAAFGSEGCPTCGGSDIDIASVDDLRRLAELEPGIAGLFGDPVDRRDVITGRMPTRSCGCPVTAGCEHHGYSHHRSL